jgi:O-antigen/teichoic acid export membrane protein
VGLVASWALLLAALDMRLARRLLRADALRQAEAPPAAPRHPMLPDWNAGALARLAVLALPLGVSAMLASLYASMPRVMLERVMGEEQLGIFAAMAYIYSAGVTCVGTLGQSVSPRLSRFYLRRQATEFTALLLKIVGLGTLMGVAGVLVAWAAGGWLLAVLYRPEYGRYANVLVWLMVGAGVGYVGSLLGYAIIAVRALKAQLLVLAGVVLVTLGAGLWLIPANGLLGAAQTLIVSGACQTIGHTAVLWRALRSATRAGPVHA